jgi:hypothetical protein
MTLVVYRIAPALVLLLWMPVRSQLVRSGNHAVLSAHSELLREALLSVFPHECFSLANRDSSNFGLHQFRDAAVGGSTSDDNESDAAIGYTGRLQLYDDSSPVMVWSAFFGPPSCSIGEPTFCSGQA